MEERKIEKYPRWARAREKIMEDSRYNAVGSSYEREQWFNEYIASQTSSVSSTFVSFYKNFIFGLTFYS